MPVATSNDVIEGIPSEVARIIDTTSTTVLLGRTSTRSRPAAHRTDESEEMDGCVMREAPPFLELGDRLGDLDELVTAHPV